MDKESDLIHRVLDGALSMPEREAVINKINADPALKNELHEIERALGVFCGERVPAPASFTSEVMENLPVHRRSYGRELWKFFFKRRTLRWNMAAAVAAAGLLIIVFASVFQLQKRQHSALYTKAPAESTVVVKVTLHAPAATKVAIAGDFNKWKADQDLLKKQENGVWALELPLRPGVYNYMFVVDDGKWVTDPNAPFYRDDAFGYKNAVLRVDTI